MDNSPTDAKGDSGRDADDKNDRLQKEILREQVRYLIKAMGGPDAAAAVWTEDGWLSYLYRLGYVLARDEHWSDVAELLGAERVDGGRSQQMRGLTVLKLPLDDENDTTGHLERVDREMGVGIATPDHIMFVTPGGCGQCCPATEPEELDGAVAPHPPITSDSGAGTGVFVSVVDTGWWPAAAALDSPSPRLDGVTGDPETIDLDHIHPYAGHGTFIAGVVRTRAPKAQIRVEGFLPTGGAAYESEMVIQLGEALALSPDIISLSAGCPTRDELPLLSFEVFWEQRLSHQKGTILVAAAGNDSHRLPFWPAAFPWTVSVGALDADGKRADYSNFGSWVDVYALGTDPVNAYPTGTFYCHQPPNNNPPVKREFRGLAKWSGTSFSTPLVSGLIAARMSQKGVSARHAADELWLRRAARVAGASGRCSSPTTEPSQPTHPL
ncbi:S8 family peptidase [Nocardioides sp. B-3]|uniref:S8 family peptidase n=1 Tax=Nocardioides sp. B-3 TaxID=2895565 RepID=UPI0021525988|nr:S8/S53 family peptidase [Nocardioides sp. B-3]UUZ61408.1 S8/S53 family peptidase [Nocardioides sp. B-3]